MASTYSPTLRTELPATGDQNDAWATTVNNNWNVPIEQGISGVVSIAMADANHTLTTANAAADQSRMAVLIFTGALTAQRTIIAPAVPKLYIIRNNTTGGYPLLVTTGSGVSSVTDTGIPQPLSAAPYSSESTTAGVPKPGAIVPAGTTAYVYTDGINFDYCVNGFDGSVSAEGIVLPTPLPIEYGGSSATTAADARTNLGLGSAATLNANPLSNPNEIVQRDASGNFTAGTITGGLAGTAATSSNTFLLGNLSPAAYQTIGTNNGFQALPFSAGNPNNIDLYNTFGAGVYLIWWQLSTEIGNNRFYTVYAYPTGVNVQVNAAFINTNTVAYGQGIQMTPGPQSMGAAGFLLGLYKRSIHQ